MWKYLAYLPSGECTSGGQSRKSTLITKQRKVSATTVTNTAFVAPFMPQSLPKGAVCASAFWEVLKLFPAT